MTDATAPSYEQRYVAFVDVLGFRNIVTRSAKEPRIVSEVWEAMNNISSRAAQSRSAGMEATSFSDNIVLSVPVDAASLQALFEVIEGLSTDLLTKNMLFRGAIVRGELVHDANVVFGPGLVSAYLLETNTAFHPRVMLHEAVFNDCARYADEGKPECRDFVSADAYDVPYLNPFARLVQADDATAVAALVQLLGIIAAGLSGSAGQPAISEKYKWLARRFDAFVTERGLSARTGLIQVDA